MNEFLLLAVIMIYVAIRYQVAEWCEKVKARPRVFLGYCGKAHETAEKLIGFLQQHEVSVREYKMDFVLGSTILDQIDRAATGLRPVF